MMLLECCSVVEANKAMTLSDAGDLANVVIAFANLIFGIYIWRYQIKETDESKLRASTLHEQSINLQWFKDLIIQPNLAQIDSFFYQLSTLRNQIQTDNLSEAERRAMMRFVKVEASKLRKSFIDILIKVSPQMHTAVERLIDNLTDELIEVFDGDEFKLTRQEVYDKQIDARIKYTRAELIGIIYNFKG